MEGTTGKHIQGGYIPQELLKELTKANNRLVIGIPREKNEEERRLALTPEGVDMLTDAGHQVIIEKDAGLGINYSDNHFSEAGAQIAATPEEVFRADLIFKMIPPLKAEVDMMKPRATVCSLIPFNCFAQDAFETMMTKRINAIAYELIADEKERYPVLSAISEIEGTTAIVIASSLLSNTNGGKGLLLGGIPGIAPTEVVIVGAGTAGTVAARAAMSMGATVKVFDDNIFKLRKLQASIGQQVFTSNFHPKVLHNAFLSADVVIGAMSYINSRRRYLIAEDLVRNMKKGSLIIDLRINQGGCFETTCGLPPNTPELFEQYGVLHYCKPSISNSVARTTSMAFSNIFVPMLIALGDTGSLQAMLKDDYSFRSGVYMFGGKPVNNYVSGNFNIMSSNIDIYLSAF